MRNTITVIVLAALLAGCATSGTPGQSQARSKATDRGDVCFYSLVPVDPEYKPTKWMTFTIDDQLMGEIRPDEWYCTKLVPGKHVVTVDGTEELLDFEVVAGVQAYVRFDEATYFFQPVLIDPATGAKEIAALRAQPRSRGR